MVCKVYNKLIQTRAIYSQGNKLFLDCGNVHNLPIRDLMGYYIQIRQSIPKTDPLVVYLKIGKQSYKLMTNSGNNFMSDQLTENMTYSVVYGSNPLHFLAVDVLPPTSAKPQL